MDDLKDFGSIISEFLTLPQKGTPVWKICFHDAFRDVPSNTSVEGHMREPYYLAYNEDNCEFLPLNDPRVDERLDKGPELVSANFVIPYPPGFPIMVPGQVLDAGTIGFMRKLDVKEIHGYDAAQGLKLIRPAALAALKGKAASKPAPAKKK